MTKIADKHCIDCDALFVRSATDSTVRCMDCRRERRERTGTVREDEYAIARECEAKHAAYVARREFGYDSDEAREALAEYLRVKRA
jgi:hypothetical protein